MFNRKIEKNLLEWKNKSNRRPLILRGARQTGKTTIVRKFAKQFSNFIELNLEKDSVRRIFSEVRDIKDVVQSIEGITNKKVIPNETLLFIDEIQNSITAIKLLRYFYEELPELHVVSAGSLLEVRMKNVGWSFPVGRVEFLHLYPVTFDEFLLALGEEILLEELMKCGVTATLQLLLHDKLLGLLADYMIIGGMPGAVKEYISSRNFITVRQLHENLFLSIKEDFSKYSKVSEVEYLKLVWDKIPFEIGSRIKYSRLAGSDMYAKGVSNAFNVLHEAMLVERIFPTTCTVLPLVKKTKAAPKILPLDIGLCTYVLNLTRDQVMEKIINSSYSGALTEIFVGQELLAIDSHNRNEFYFWIREEKGASSELDFLVPINNKLVPIEVKSGSHGSLKSMHQFLNKSKSSFGVRIYNGSLSSDNCLVSLPDKHKIKVELLSLPVYLTFRLVELCKEHL